jgi:hypothetical protein
MMFVSLLTMAVSQFFDFGTFVVMVRLRGPGAEANPLVATILDGLGLPGIALAKAALVLLVAATAMISAGRDVARRDRLAGAVLATAIAAGLLGGMTNALTTGPI